MATYVCDANVLVAAFVPEEESDLAESFTKRIRTRDITAIAPQQALAEVGTLFVESWSANAYLEMLTSVWHDFRSLPVD